MEPVRSQYSSARCASRRRACGGARRVREMTKPRDLPLCGGTKRACRHKPSRSRPRDRELSNRAGIRRVADEGESRHAAEAGMPPRKLDERGPGRRPWTSSATMQGPGPSALASER